MSYSFAGETPSHADAKVYFVNLKDGDFKIFIAELEKIKITLTAEQEERWYDRFHRLQNEITEIDKKIQNNESTLNDMVYQLYNLNQDEINYINNQITN